MIRTLRTEAPVLRCIWPYPMDETKFTIAFNEFAVVDAAGGPLSRNDGRALADFLFERFAINFEEIGLHLPYELRPPAHTCPIRGRTSKERSQVAAEMAGKINADIIIYGVITDTAKPQVALEFYVGSLGFEEGEEIAGPYALGDPLPIDLPFRAQTLKVIEHPPHLVRTDVLSLIALGLSYYATDNPTKALEYYTQAEQNDYWPRTDGKEIIYLLLGNAMLRQASVEFTSATLSAARDNYQQALEINPGYARAKVGEAVTLYMMALGDPEKISEATLDQGMLQQALTTYQEALAMGQAAGDAEIEPKVHAGLGQIYFVQGLIGQAGMIEQAKAEMQWVVDAFEQGDTHLATRAGYAHGYLGTIATVERDTDGAIAQFQQAVKMATPFYQSFYYTRLGNVYCEKGQTDLALAAYQDAIDRARLYGYRQKVEDYTAKLEEMRGEGCP
jgi:tetratricopeptide (TPR) repeat protein